MEKSHLQRRELARTVRAQRVEDLHDAFVAAGIERAFVTFENGEFRLSHPRLLAPVRSFFELSADFARHEGVFIGREDGLPTLFFAFVHDTRRGLAQGGLRLKGYENLADVLEDGLRLSQGMTRKNALAGLWWGGGKGIIPITSGLDTPEFLDPAAPQRRRLFQAYGRFIAGLGGIYYTAEDIGTKTADMNAILSQNRFVTCIAPELGGSGNPSPFTARGVFKAMQAAWRFLTGSDRLAGVKVAVQGAGNVGAPLIELLDDAGARVWMCDPNAAALDALRQRRPRLQVVGADEIFDLDADVFAPCAIGNQVRSDTIPRLKVRLICGAANNILGEPADAERLRERDIAFVPDYVCNRMGITNCCDEWQGYLGGDVELAAERVYPDTLRVLKHARNLVITTTAAADELADIEASELHPLIGHRGRRLIDHLEAASDHRDDDEANGNGAREEPIFVPARHEPEIRRLWDREGFRGDGPALAAAPVSAAFRPHLGSVLSPLLMDVRARALEAETGRRCRRVLGADPGGLALQLAVERSLPYEREEVGRPELVQICRDLYRRNDAAVREQLHQLGVGFDPGGWLDVLSSRGAEAVRRLYFALKDAGLVTRQKGQSFYCPRCGTVRVSSDVKPTKLRLLGRYTVRFELEGGGEITVQTFFPELLVGAAAVAVRAGGLYAPFAGRRALHPSSGLPLPVVQVESWETEASFLVPAYSRTDEAAARQHGIDSYPEVFDEQGEIALPGQPPAGRDEARRKLAAHLATRTPPALTREEGQWQVLAHRCRRCETIVNPTMSEQLFVRLDAVRPALEAALHSGAVTVPSPRWRRWLEDYLGTLEPLCISRQQWWGNELPSDPEQSLSTWFSLAAWSLLGTGWPQQALPQPVEEVFVDPELLRRWVVPSQLICLALTGRPAFRRIHVHGVLHVVDRSLQPIPEREVTEPDEERFRYQATARPMRKQLGNVVEPATLVRRFGADALRLGYLLSLSPGRPDVVTLSEGNLRRGRRSHHRLVATLGGLARLAARPTLGSGRQAPRLAERWILAVTAEAAARTREAYREARLEEAAGLLVETVESLRLYARRVASRESGAPEATLGPTLAAVLERLAAAFTPIFPFTFDHLRRWAEEKGFQALAQSPAAAPGDDAWLAPLVAELRQGGRKGKVVVATPDVALLTAFEAEQEELAALAGREVEITAEPPAGRARGFGRCLVVRPGGTPRIEGSGDAAAWYRELHETSDTRSPGERSPGEIGEGENRIARS